ncbi:MAG: YihY/virulence factor BrkB family protein [Methylacidiphilales bacterium]|nr:YihY/virulence factor BrkB family protein [Candidatus Methylacidiphilales bacterium]
MWKWLYGPILVTKVDRLSTYASALAYCFVLSMIPFLVVTFAVGSELAPGRLDLAGAYRDLLDDILPGADTSSISTQIIATLQSNSQVGLKTIGFILAVYTSFNLMEQIVRTLLFIFDDPRRPQGWSWLVVVKTVALLLLWMFLLLLISIVSVVTPVIHSILRQFSLDSQLWIAPLLIGRDVVLTAALFGAFFLTYYLVPSKRYNFDQIRDGSIVATCGWVVCSLLFADVLPNMWHMNAVYKALGSIVVILLWAQACSWSVVIGACWIVRFSPSRAK